MPQSSKVLLRRPRPTTKSYRKAVKKIVLALQAAHELSDAELAERVACSEGTIANARKETASIGGVTLANIEHEFGPSAVDPFMALGGSRAVPLEAVCNTDHDPCLALTDALRSILAMRSKDSPGGIEELPEEIAPTLPTLRAARQVLDVLIDRGSRLSDAEDAA